MEWQGKYQQLFIEKLLPPEFEEKGTSISMLPLSDVISMLTSAVVTALVVLLFSFCTVDTATELGTLILVASSCIVYWITHLSHNDNLNFHAPDIYEFLLCRITFMFHKPKFSETDENRNGCKCRSVGHFAYTLHSDRHDWQVKSRTVNISELFHFQ